MEGDEGDDTFNWGKIIRTMFKRQGDVDVLPLKEARKVVLGRYTKHLAKADGESGGEKKKKKKKAPPTVSEFKALFLEKVAKTKRVSVDGKELRLQRKS